jgi:hypothetical protein
MVSLEATALYVERERERELRLLEKRRNANTFSSFAALSKLSASTRKCPSNCCIANELG